MWHIEFNLITACLARLGKAVMFMEAGSRLATESRPGSLGMTLCADARAFFPERLRTLLAGSPEQPFRALLWVAHCPAELAAFQDVVDPAVRRHARARPAG